MAGFAFVFVLFLFVLIGLVPIGIAIWTAVDASKYPEWAFRAANSSKTLWIVLPLVGSLACGIVGIVTGIVWFTSIKPRVVAAGFIPPPPPPNWS